MKTIFILSAAAATITLFSCKKEKNHPEAHSHATTATITVTNPQEGDTIQGNFNITGSIVGSAELHGYQVTVTNVSDNSIVYQKDIHDHLANFAINESVTHSFSNYTKLKLEVVVAIDHDGNKETKTVHFTVH